MASGRQDSYGCSLLAGARRAAHAAGVDLLVRSAAGTTVREQGLALERLLGMPLEDRPNALVLDPIRYGPLAFMTRSAHDQFLPVVLIDEPVGINPGLVWTFVSSDEAAVGRRAATELVRLLGGRRGATLLVTSHE
ncbi:MAG: substrate-binding domain-containing protein, partial [Candidatus Binatia bacterium]